MCHCFTFSAKPFVLIQAKCFRQILNKTTSKVDLCLVECGNAAVTVGYLVPEHPLSGQGCHCLIWVTAQPQPNLFLCLELTSFAKQLPNRTPKGTNTRTPYTYSLCCEPLALLTSNLKSMWLILCFSHSFKVFFYSFLCFKMQNYKSRPKGVIVSKRKHCSCPINTSSVVQLFFVCLFTSLCNTAPPPARRLSSCLVDSPVPLLSAVGRCGRYKQSIQFFCCWQQGPTLKSLNLFPHLGMSRPSGFMYFWWKCPHNKWKTLVPTNQCSDES